MIKFSELTAEEIELVSDGCGIVAKGLRVPDFIFKARCDQHDFNWCRGTGWAWNSHWFLPYSIIRWYVQGQYWIQRSNFQFLYWMLVDAWDFRHQPIEKAFYSWLAVTYFLAVFFVALLPSTKRMTNWRSKDDIIAYAAQTKHHV